MRKVPRPAGSAPIQCQSFAFNWRSIFLLDLLAIAIVSLSVAGCAGGDSGASTVQEATPTTSFAVASTTPTASAARPIPAQKIQTPVRLSFDTVRIVAEREVADNHIPFHSLPLWSPDGSRIVFTKKPAWDTNPGWSPWGEIWIADGDGSNPRLIVANGLGAGWSRDSQWLYFSSTEPHDMGREMVSTDVYRIRQDGTDEALLYRESPNRGIYVAPCMLPDGRVAFLGVSPQQIVFLEPEKRRTIGSLPDVTGLSRFWCSPDGSQIAYAVGRLWIGPSDGSTRRLLGDVSADESLPISWSANGRSLVYTTVDELWVAGADGSNPRKVLDVSAFPETKDNRGPHFSWPFLSADGQLIFVSFFPGLRDNSAAGPEHTYVVDVASGRVKAFAERKSLVALSPDGLMGLLTYSWIGTDGWVRRPLIAVTIGP